MRLSPEEEIGRLVFMGRCSQGEAQMGKRLATILNMVPKCGTVADIGCDHGKLAASLLLRGVCEKVIATDISRPSLDKARGLAIHLGLSGMECREGDGLATLSPGEADVIVMAGWGGRNLYEALGRQREVAENAWIILQPMSEAADLRRLLQADYTLMDEELALERGRYYDILMMRAGRGEAYDDFLCGIGPLLLQKKHPLLKGKLQRWVNRWEKEVDALSGRGSDGACARRLELGTLIRRYNEVIAWL
ncbi:MAG: tRNA (adenine(22)-N(1))-methyltransferase [Christensenellales bacterium]|jgi:tRNA (adenine22-N1)-methyltransferase